MKIFSITDVGQKREINEDYLFCNETGVGTFSNMFIVADGMGGHNAGDFASRFCIEEFIRRIESSAAKTAIAKIEAALIETNEAMIAKSLEDAAYEGMGTTFVLATINGDIMYVANIGDSRLYLIEDDSILQITHDHSLVEEMIKNGDILREEARFHPNKNVITRALGVNRHVEIDFFEVTLKPGNIVLLCSDGLTNMLDDREIYSIIKNNEADLEACGHKLVKSANENGGKDNIAIILIAY